jgi:hypothetical protein
MPRTPREFRAKVIELLNDETYLTNLSIRLREGTCAPGIERLFWEVAANIVQKVEITDRTKRPITGDVQDPVERAKLLFQKAASLSSGIDAQASAADLLKSISEKKVH